jgi:hypothetical protein
MGRSLKLSHAQERIEFWSGYISGNHHVHSKYWDCEDHFHEHNLVTILYHLRRAIKELEAEGIKASLKTDVWNSSKETFLHILKGFLYEFQQLIHEYSIEDLKKAIGSDDQAGAQNKQVIIEGELTKEMLQPSLEESKEEPPRMAGPMKIDPSKPEKAALLYFRMLREGRSEDDIIVKLCKQIAMGMGKAQDGYVFPFRTS